MRGLLVGCVVLSVQVLWACGGASGETGSKAEAQSAPAPAAPAATTPAQKLLAAYLNVQRRLAADDAKGAKAGRWAWDVFLVRGQ